MFRRGRRRFKRRLAWLPGPGTQLDQNAVAALKATENPKPIETIFGTLPGAPVTVSAPLIIDNPISETLGTAALSVYQNLALNQVAQYGYKLVRIVGDIFVGVNRNNNQANSPPGVLVQAGIIVRRTDEDGQPAVLAADQDVGSIQNDADPWVWQRSWILNPSDRQTIAGSGALSILTNFPHVNTEYGTKHHIAIDQKTARTVSPEQRLFLTITAWQLPLNQTATASGTTNDTCNVYVLMPYRVLGRVFPTGGNRNNAAR